MPRSPSRGQARRPVTIPLLLTILLSVLTPFPAPSQETEETEQTPSTDRRADLGAGFTPSFAFHGFADVTFAAEREGDDLSDSGDSAFVLGEFDFFLVASLTSSISFLGEAVFEARDDGTQTVDVERLVVKYTLSDRLWFSLGRHHTPLGYWNETYHHGLLLQPTVDRPEALKFEDKGGILPVHTVGAYLGGRLPGGRVGLKYVAGVSNGRDITRETTQAVSDSNDFKAITGKLVLTVGGENSLEFGPSFYLDRIPPDPGLPERQEEIDEGILGFHFVYRNDDGLELISEFYNVDHRGSSGDRSFNHRAYYAIGTWRRFRWKPYVGIDRLDLDAEDPYFSGIEPDLERFLVGVRFDLHPFNAWKLEYRREDRSGTKTDVVAIQTAFGF